MKKRRIRIVTAVILSMAVLVSGCGLFQDFDAQEYVRAVLDQNFQGEVDAAAKMMQDTSEKQLREQYEEEIHTFVTNNLTSGVEMSNDLLNQYLHLTKNIFRSMKYQVNEVKKNSKKEYDVNVEIQPADVFVTFVEKVKVHSEDIKKRAESGEYQGTKEEINAQMQSDYVEEAYSLLEECYQNMQYGEAQTVVIKVKGNDKKEFSVEEEDVYNMVTKILRLDEIQD